MNQKMAVVLIVFCTLLAILFVGMIGGTAMFLLFGNTGGIVGELLADAEIATEVDLASEQVSLDATDTYPSKSQEEQEQIPLETVTFEGMVDVMPDEIKPLPEEMESYFDFDMEQIPTHAGFTRVRKGMRLAIVVSLMGKPHRYIGLTEDTVVLLWKTDTEETVTVNVAFGQGDYDTEEERWNDARVTDVFR